MTEQNETCLPVAVWFLYSEQDEPLGQVYRAKEDAVPTMGVKIDNRPNGESVEVVEFSELRATCAMRRFRVVVRAT